MMRAFLLSVPVALALVLGGCDDDVDGIPGADAGGGDSGTAQERLCDPIHTARCAMPWPSNLYLEEDASRVTGHTLAFGEESLPANIHGVHPKPEPYRMLDGYGVGTAVLVSFPNVDTASMPAEDDIARSLDADSPTVWLELNDAGEVVGRVPHWAELDLNATDPENQTLFLRPAVILKEATRYVVAFRDLQTVGGTPIEPEEAFARLRDGDTGSDPALAPRQDRFDEVFAALESEGIDRSELTLAWDFNSASSDALHGRMLEMRDEGLAALEADGPQLTFGEVTTHTVAEDPHVAIDIEGTFRVASFLREDTINDYTSRRLNQDASGDVMQNGWMEAPFWLRIPRSAVDGTATPQALMIYGHGLLGSGSQVKGSANGEIGNEFGILPFATDWLGMADENLLDATQALNDMSRFPFMAEQLHQGLLNFIVLTRVMRDGLQAALDAHPDTQGMDIVVSTDPSDVYYSGISQGGIFGGSLMALTPDITHGHLGVPGNNYTTLLQRSVDFDIYAAVMRNFYPDTVDQAIGLGLIGLLWEMTEPVSYLRHVQAEPFPGNDPHRVLLAAAKGDWQVANVTNEIAARSDMGIALMENYGREVELVTPTPYPHEGSGLVMYDFGNPWPPLGNVPPDDEIGDPHGKPRYEPHHIQQLGHFLQTGEIIDVCGGDGCTPD